MAFAFLRKGKSWLGRLIGVLLFLFLVTKSTIQIQDARDLVRQHAREWEFNFVSWTIEALLKKAGQFGVGATSYLHAEEATGLVRGYVDLIGEVNQLENQLTVIASDASLDDPQGVAAPIVEARNDLRARQQEMQPVVENILQEQVAIMVVEEGIQFGGSAFPPVVFHFTQPPVALIISPRQVIRQDANISLEPSLTLEEVQALEIAVEREADISALVVPIGGIGIYPTMISESTSLEWITDVIAHEWVHNYLTLRPLGLRYFDSPELRTMNETTASLLGREIGRRVLKRYYPDLVPPPPLEIDALIPAVENPPVFDFRAEMRETRLTVDALLAEGRIAEAEAYMEERRQFLWENGYHIRRLNQAYFAFYGAYADEPGGAAGDDPVGDAVRRLWELSDSPAEFLRTMSRMADFQDLEQALQALSAEP